MNHVLKGIKFLKFSSVKIIPFSEIIQIKYTKLLSFNHIHYQDIH